MGTYGRGIAFCQTGVDTSPAMTASDTREGERLQQLGIGHAISTPTSLLRWVYFWRVAVVIVVFVAAAFSFRSQSPSTILALAVAALLSVFVTVFSVWYTHIRRVRPGPTFLYTQALFDLALVTTIVHLTGGA